MPMNSQHMSVSSIGCSLLNSSCLGLLDCNAIKYCSRIQKFRRTSTLKMVAKRSSETLVTYRNSTWSHNPGDLDLKLHRRENLKHRDTVLEQLMIVHLVTNLLIATWFRG